VEICFIGTEWVLEEEMYCGNMKNGNVSEGVGRSLW
jgi:hypothetical protein